MALGSSAVLADLGFFLSRASSWTPPWAVDTGPLEARAGPTGHTRMGPGQPGYESHVGLGSGQPGPRQAGIGSVPSMAGQQSQAGSGVGVEEGQGTDGHLGWGLVNEIGFYSVPQFPLLSNSDPGRPLWEAARL